MKHDELLDPIEKEENNKFTLKAETALFSAVFFLIICIGFIIFATDLDYLNFMAGLSMIGFVISSIVGFIFTILSYIYNEDKSNFRLYISAGNLIIFFLVMTLIGLSIVGRNISSIG